MLVYRYFMENLELDDCSAYETHIMYEMLADPKAFPQASKQDREDLLKLMARYSFEDDPDEKEILETLFQQFKREKFL